MKLSSKARAHVKAQNEEGNQLAGLILASLAERQASPLPVSVKTIFDDLLEYRCFDEEMIEGEVWVLIRAGFVGWAFDGNVDDYYYHLTE